MSSHPISTTSVRHPLHAGRHTLSDLVVVSILGCVMGLTACGAGERSGAASATTPEATMRATVPLTSATSTTNSEPARADPAISSPSLQYLFTRVTGAGGGVLLSGLDGSGVVTLARDVPGVHKHAQWAPDGERVVFVDETSETMWIAHVDGASSEQIPGCDHDGCDYPSFSPDGTEIAYSRARSRSGVVGPASVAIEIIDLASRVVTEVVRLERPLLADVPRWSPDGTQLVIGVDQMDAASDETGAAIAIVSADGGELRYLTDFPAYAYAPDWNFATGEIVFGPTVRESAADFKQDETWDVWAIQPDGTALREITHAEPGEQVKGAKWTPDGATILARSTTRGIVSIDPTTGEMTPLPGLPDDVTSPKLRPTP